MSQDSRPILKRQVSNGERLTYHVKKQGSPWKAYNIVPSDWVVTKVVQYEPLDLGELPEFRGVNYPTARSRGLSVALIWSARLQDNTEPLGLFTEPPTSSITFEPFSCFIAMIVTMPTLKRFATPIRLAFGRMNVQALVASLRSVCRIDGNQFNP